MTPARRRPARLVRRLVLAGLVGILLALALKVVPPIAERAIGTIRTTPLYDPPVQAGQHLASGCAGGVYARTGDGLLVLTVSGHCFGEGFAVMGSNGEFLGLASAPTNWAACDVPGTNRCTGSDMAYISMVPAQIPWGRLDQIDMGAGGYRTVAPGQHPLACADIAEGDRAEFDGHAMFRTGTVLSRQEYHAPPDATYFPCIVLTDIRGMSGDSGGIVLVNGLPGGVASRVFGADAQLGFTPLAPGLDELGLALCDSPDCGLAPETAANRLLSTTAP